MTFFLTRWFYVLMQFLYGLFSNSYLLTILVVTILLRLVQIFPDISNRKTQIKMAVVQPKINELQKKYQNVVMAVTNSRIACQILSLIVSSWLS